MRRKLGFALFGLVFGFTLARSGASDYNYIHRMFTGENLHLAFLMGTAIVVGALGMFVLRGTGNRTIDGDPVKVKPIPLSWGSVAGGAIFGLGWGISGACPGTVLAQLGEGKVLALFTVSGLLLGTYVFAVTQERQEAENRKVPSPAK